MILFGSYKALVNQMYLPCVVYNLTSPVQVGNRLFNLFPPARLDMFVDEFSYDLCLSDWLMNNDQAFKEMMLILFADYDGQRVLCLIDDSPWAVSMTESLAKFIQVRYGLSVNIINEPSDVEEAKESCYSIEGRQNFQADKERYVYSDFNAFMARDSTNEDA